MINKYGDVYCSISSDTDSYQEYVGKLMGGFTWEGQNEAYLTGVHETVIQLANRKVITVLQRLYYYGSYVGVLSVDLNYDELGPAAWTRPIPPILSARCAWSEGTG